MPHTLKHKLTCRADLPTLTAYAIGFENGGFEIFSSIDSKSLYASNIDHDISEQLWSPTTVAISDEIASNKTGDTGSRVVGFACTQDAYDAGYSHLWVARECKTTKWLSMAIYHVKLGIRTELFSNSEFRHNTFYSKVNSLLSTSFPAQEIPNVSLNISSCILCCIRYFPKASFLAFHPLVNTDTLDSQDPFSHLFVGITRLLICYNINNTTQTECFFHSLVGRTPLSDLSDQPPWVFPDYNMETNEFETSEPEYKGNISKMFDKFPPFEKESTNVQIKVLDSPENATPMALIDDLTGFAEQMIEFDPLDKSIPWTFVPPTVDFAPSFEVEFFTQDEVSAIQYLNPRTSILNSINETPFSTFTNNIANLYKQCCSVGLFPHNYVLTESDMADPAAVRIKIIEHMVHLLVEHNMHSYIEFWIDAQNDPISSSTKSKTKKQYYNNENENETLDEFSNSDQDSLSEIPELVDDESIIAQESAEDILSFGPNWVLSSPNAVLESLWVIYSRCYTRYVSLESELFSLNSSSQTLPGWSPLPFTPLVNKENDNDVPGPSLHHSEAGFWHSQRRMQLQIILGQLSSTISKISSIFPAFFNRPSTEIGSINLKKKYSTLVEFDSCLDLVSSLVRFRILPSSQISSKTAITLTPHGSYIASDNSADDDAPTISEKSFVSSMFSAVTPKRFSRGGAGGSKAKAKGAGTIRKGKTLKFQTPNPNTMRNTQTQPHFPHLISSLFNTLQERKQIANAFNSNVSLEFLFPYSEIHTNQKLHSQLQLEYNSTNMYPSPKSLFFFNLFITDSIVPFIFSKSIQQEPHITTYSLPSCSTIGELISEIWVHWGKFSSKLVILYILQDIFQALFEEYPTAFELEFCSTFDISSSFLYATKYLYAIDSGVTIQDATNSISHYISLSDVFTALYQINPLIPPALLTKTYKSGSFSTLVSFYKESPDITAFGNLNQLLIIGSLCVSKDFTTARDFVSNFPFSSPVCQFNAGIFFLSCCQTLSALDVLINPGLIAPNIVSLDVLFNFFCGLYLSLKQQKDPHPLRIFNPLIYYLVLSKHFVLAVLVDDGICISLEQSNGYGGGSMPPEDSYRLYHNKHRLLIKQIYSCCDTISLDTIATIRQLCSSNVNNTDGNQNPYQALLSHKSTHSSFKQQHLLYLFLNTVLVDSGSNSVSFPVDPFFGVTIDAEASQTSFLSISKYFKSTKPFPNSQHLDDSVSTKPSEFHGTLPSILRISSVSKSAAKSKTRTGRKKTRSRRHVKFSTETHVSIETPSTSEEVQIYERDASQDDETESSKPLPKLSFEEVHVPILVEPTTKSDEDEDEDAFKVSKGKGKGGKDSTTKGRGKQTKAVPQLSLESPPKETDIMNEEEEEDSTASLATLPDLVDEEEEKPSMRQSKSTPHSKQTKKTLATQTTKRSKRKRSLTPGPPPSIFGNVGSSSSRRSRRSKSRSQKP